MPSRKRSSEHKTPKKAPNRATLEKHLIVDGYNLIHADLELKKKLQRDGVDAVRDALGQKLSILHDYEGWRLTIVFDGRGQALTIERPSKVPTFSFVYSPSGISADEVIEALVAKGAGRDDTLVCTSDSAIRIFIQANGARWLPSEELWRWLKDAEASLTRALKRSRA